MITEWRYKAQLITTNKGAGDQLYLALRAFPNDPAPAASMFDIELSDGAWALEYSVKKTFADLVAEYNAGGYPQALLDTGKSKSEIDAMRSVIKVDCYDLYENNEQYKVKPNALNEFIAAQGFTKL